MDLSIKVLRSIFQKTSWASQYSEQLNINFQSVRDLVFISPTFLVSETADCRQRERERERGDTDAKFVGIKVDCKDSKFANKISPLCKNQIKLFYISCLTNPDPPSIFSITKLPLRDNFLPELCLCLWREYEWCVGSVIWDQNRQPLGYNLQVWYWTSDQRDR